MSRSCDGKQCESSEWRNKNVYGDRSKLLKIVFIRNAIFCLISGATNFDSSFFSLVLFSLTHCSIIFQLWWMCLKVFPWLVKQIHFASFIHPFIQINCPKRLNNQIRSYKYISTVGATTVGATNQRSVDIDKFFSFWIFQFSILAIIEPDDFTSRHQAFKDFFKP